MAVSHSREDISINPTNGPSAPISTTNTTTTTTATTTNSPSTSSMPPISVLFVCLGNICRSPMAEAVFRSLSASDPRLSKIDSAGTGAYHEGDSPDPRTLSTLAQNGIVDYDHAARKVQGSDFTTFDYILAMDKENLHDLQRLRQRVINKSAGAGKEMGQVMLFGHFGGEKGEVVIDPYYGARDGFAVAYEQMVRFSKGFIGQILDHRDTAPP